MTFLTKRLPKSQIAIEVELAAEELEAYRTQALGALAKDLPLEGFRPGHIPQALAAKYLGEQAVWGEIARLAIVQTYEAIVKQENLDVIGEPEVQVLKLAPGNPLEFRIQVAVLPAVELPDYKKIATASSRKPVMVEDKEVEEAFECLQKNTENFQKATQNFETTDDLKTSIQEGLQHEKEMQERDRVRQEIIEKIAKEAKLEVPNVLVEREKRVLLSQLKQGVAQVLRITFEEYLQKAGKTEQETLDAFAKEAEHRVRRFLVVREVAKKEAIGPTQEEIAEEAKAMLNHYASGHEAKQELDLQKLKEYTEGVLRYEKTLQFLEQFAQKL